jgi:hypothetical protein
MPLKNKGKSNQEEGFKEGGWFSKMKKKVTKGVKKTFMKPINDMKNAILKPIKNIEDFIRAVLCFALFLKLVFEWFSNTFILLTKYFFAAPLCFGFWVLDSFMRFFQYIIIDVLLNLVLQPSIYIGTSLGYPFVDDFKITGEHKKSLYKNTNVVRWMIKGIDDNLNLKFKIYKGCFQIGGIDPFPKYYS